MDFGLILLTNTKINGQGCKRNPLGEGNKIKEETYQVDVWLYGCLGVSQ